MKPRLISIAALMFAALLALFSCSEKKEVYYSVKYSELKDAITAAEGRVYTGEISRANSEVAHLGTKIYRCVNTWFTGGEMMSQSSPSNVLSVDDDGSFVSRFSTFNDATGGTTADGRYRYSAVGVVVYDTETGGMTFTAFTDANGVPINYSGASDICPLPDGRILMSYPVFGTWRGEEYSATAFLIFGEDGKYQDMIVPADIGEEVADFGNGGSGVRDAAASEDGKLCLLSDDYIARVSIDGNDFSVDKWMALDELEDFRDGKVAKKPFSDFSDHCLIKDTAGNIYLEYNAYLPDGTTAYRICAIADGEELLGEPVTLYGTKRYRPFLDGNGMVCYSDSSAIRRVGIPGETSDKEEEIVCYLSDIDLGGDMVDDVYMRPDGEMIISVRDGDTFSPRILDVTESEVPTDERRVLTVAYEEGEYTSPAVYELIQQVKYFNRSDEDYRIRLAGYTSDADRSANDKMLRDVISGRVADIVMISDSITPDVFVKHDAFIDIYTLMDKDEKYGRDSFIPAGTEPFETDDGELPYLAVGVAPMMLGGNKETLTGNDFSTLSGFNEFAERVNESGAALMPGTGEESAGISLLKQLLPGVLGGQVDYGTGKCDFSGDFKELLRVCGNARVSVMGDEEDEPALGIFYMDDVFSYLLSKHNISGNPDDIIAVGFPSCGDGALIRIGTAFGVTKRCADPDGAWRFITAYLDGIAENWKQGADNPNSISLACELPTTKDGFEYAMSAARRSALVLDPNEQINPVTGKKSVGYSMRIERAYTPEELDELLESRLNWIGVFPGEPAPTLDSLTTEQRYNLLPNYLRHDFEGEVVTFSDKDEALLRDVFENSGTPANSDQKLIGIILEEASAYFSGAQTLDRTVEVISDRVKTRLAE